jgi:hypothetical protein
MVLIGLVARRLTPRSHVQGFRPSLAGEPAVSEVSTPGIPTFIPTTGARGTDSGVPVRMKVLIGGYEADLRPLPGAELTIYDLFEGTEQIQQLVISRAISGVHIR